MGEERARISFYRSAIRSSDQFGMPQILRSASIARGDRPSPQPEAWRQRWSGARVHGVGRLAAGVEPVLTGNRHPSIAPYGVFGCADADIVIAVGSESLWRRFAPIVDLDADRTGDQDEAFAGYAPSGGCR